MQTIGQVTWHPQVCDDSLLFCVCSASVWRWLRVMYKLVSLMRELA